MNRSEAGQFAEDDIPLDELRVMLARDKHPVLTVDPAVRSEALDRLSELSEGLRRI